MLYYGSGRRINGSGETVIEQGLLTASFLSLLIWLGLAFLRGGYWRANQRLGRGIDMDRWPAVVAVIPARNEAETIGLTVNSLLKQKYNGKINVVVVDDNSDDETSVAAGQNDRLTILTGKPLEPGWTGKLWAIHQGLQAIKTLSPTCEYVLFTDADIEHHSDNVRELVSKATRNNRHLVSLMVSLRCESFWEKLLIPAFVYFFQKLYPFPLVNKPDHPIAAAAGGCMLVRLETLMLAGGIAPIKGRLIDDCAMGALIKQQAPIWLGLSAQTKSLRAYDSLAEIWHMVARTAFVQLNHSVGNLIGTVIAMVLIYMVPPFVFVYGLITHEPVLWILAGGAYLIMAQLYAPTLRLYEMSFFRAFLLPVAGLFYTLMTVSSAVRHWRGQGGNWKGRSYSKPS